MRAIVILLPILALNLLACAGAESLLNLATGGWSVSEHPCMGTSTDAMWFEDATTGWVGCGATRDGYGLYSTTNAGRSWQKVSGVVESMRVTSISRAPDGRLFVGGTGNAGLRVATVSGSSSKAFYSKPEKKAQSWQTFQVGSFQVDGRGRAVSESLTGSDVMFWPNASGASVTAEQASNGHGWWTTTDLADGGAQILDLEVYNDTFYGVGSTINQPPYFYFDSKGEGFGLKAVRLDSVAPAPFKGEVWDLSIDSAGGMVAAGVNQDKNLGVLWFSTGDVSSAEGWRYRDAGVSHTPTRFYGACRDGKNIAAVGDYSQLGHALLMRSSDGGDTWKLHDPPATDKGPRGPLSRCQFVEEKLYVTGSDGLFAVVSTL